MNAPQRARTRTIRADLHVHTRASDGKWTPAQVVDGCRAKGIGLLAVADHDTTDSVLSADHWRWSLVWPTYEPSRSHQRRTASSYTSLPTA